MPANFPAPTSEAMPEIPARNLVVIPTYNELENLPIIVERTLAVDDRLDVLVVDDASPDGTGQLADALAMRSPRVHVLHRFGKEGLGAAYLAAFGWALERDYDTVVEMDADGSHRPEQLPRLYAALGAGADLVLGSRWVPGGGVENWPRRREVLSRGGNWYVRRALRLPLRDATGGFRVFRADTLRRLALDDVDSTGYCFQVDLARRVVRAGMVVSEVPIDFTERELGVSKMTGSIVREALWRVTAWGIRDRVSGRTGTTPASVAPPAQDQHRRAA
ncbi:polyprenol monophosphomannose synthase [Nocardioides marmoraquaticus]